MAFLKRNIAISLFLAGYCLPVLATDLRSTIADLENRFENQQHNIQLVRQDLNRKTLEIEKLKSDNNGLVSKLVVQKKLREAQSVSKTLEALIKNQTTLNQALHTQRAKLLEEIDGEIASLSSQKSNHTTAQLQRFGQLVSEKERLIFLQHQMLFEVPDFNLSSSSQSGKDELTEKLQVVEDLQKNIKQKIALMKEELSEEKSREFLRKEMSHFLDEESFFSEQSFISVGVNRKDTTTTVGAMALHTGTPNAKVAGGDVAPPVDTDTGNAPTPDNSQPSAASMATISQSSSSQFTAFQQPQDLQLFQNLLDQVRETVKNTDPKVPGEESVAAKKPAAGTIKVAKLTKKAVLEQNLALSEKILSDLDTLHERLSKQIQTLE